jgi:uracil-DNA glycosylase
MTDLRVQLVSHQAALRTCTRCPAMNGPPVTGEPAVSPVMLVGQAPGTREIERRRPFAWTAGKTLYGWFEGIGVDEATFRERVYMAAVCRCFPGKNTGGGDRVPTREEVESCAPWLDAELRMLMPKLVIPVGKLAIGRFMAVQRLDHVVGRLHRVAVAGIEADLIPLPHPSGASPWHRVEAGKQLLMQALTLIGKHPAWREVSGDQRP